MMLDVISLKVKSLSDSQKSKIATILPILCGDRAGKMKYVAVEGLLLGNLTNKFVGSDVDMYLNCLVDTISIVSANTDKGISICDTNSSVIAPLLKVKVREGDLSTRVDILSSWSRDFIDETEVVTDELESEDYEDDSFYDSYDENDVDEGEPEVYDEPDETNTSDEGISESELRNEIKIVFNSTVISLVSKVKKRYDLLFESGYDLSRPYGILTQEGIIYVDSEKVLKVRENPDKDIDFSASMNMYDLVSDKIGLNLSDARSSKNISLDMLEGYTQSGNLNYFPYKLLEYAYGRNPSNEESKTYNYATIRKSGTSVGVSTKWKDFGTKIVEDVKLTIEDSIVAYCLDILKTGYDKEAIRNAIRQPKNIKDIQGYIEYVADSLSTCIIITDYKSNNAKPVLLKLRVCDPKNMVGDDLITEIIYKAFSGNTGGSDGVRLSSGLNSTDSRQYGVYEYGHEFNHLLSNAMPLFAYKAYEKLKEKGEAITYKDLVLGQSTDGTILRNGTHGLILDKNLFHYINAGSRSGKGVMTLNLVAAALLSNKAVIYLDNKPDMVSMLAQLCGGKEYGNEKGPLFFGLNGSNNVDDKQHQFTHEDKWINRDNIPIEAVTLFGEPSWRKYGDIFYMRAFTLAFGIILARGLDGGHGKMNDPAYNGTDGIFLVCDETNVLQENFKIIGQILADKIPLQAKKFISMSSSLKSLYKEANSENARKGANLKYESAKRDFEEAFNAHKFYALSYLNTLSDNIAYIYQKSLAGFLPKEAECSDILVIGQNLEQTPIDKDTITAAVSSGRLSGEGSGTNGLGGTQIAKDIKGASSIPLAHFVFSSADALIGYNSLYPEYLAQMDSTSKACGKLDLVANNFCYLPNFKISASSEESPGVQLTKGLANADSSVYFKPYLILNNSSQAYTSQMFDRVANAGLTQEDVINEYPNNDGNDISPYIGFPEYMSLMGVSDIPERLKKGADIANMVVGQVLGYPDDGSGRPLWLQFVTDLRPEWLVSVRDVACMCGDLEADANVSKGKDNPLLKEYYGYLDFVTEHKELGIIDTSMSSPEAYFTDEDGNRQYDVSGYESQARRDFYATDDYSDEEAENEAFTKRMQSSFCDNATYDDNEFIDLFGDDDNTSDSQNTSSDKDSGAYVDEKDAIILSLLETLKKNNIDVGQFDWYNINPQKQGVDYGYTKPDHREEFNAEDIGNLEFDEGNEELSANSFAHLIQLVTSKVIMNYGGYDRITSFRVIGGSIIINGTVFRSKVSSNCLGVLPLDIRRQISSGNLSELFNYRELLKMPNLRGLEFDSVDFTYDTVSKVLGYSNIGINNFFDDIKSLQVLIVGDSKFTRQDYKEKMKENDIFYYKSSVTKYAAVCDKHLCNFTSKSWNFTKNMFNSKNHGLVTKTLGVLFGTTVSATSGVVTLGAKAVKGISSKVDSKHNRSGIGNAVKSGFSAFKEGFKDLFND